MDSARSRYLTAVSGVGPRARSFGSAEQGFSQLVVSGRHEREEDLGHQGFPGHRAPLVGALGNAAKERKHRVGDAAQESDDKSRARVGFNPRVVVLPCAASLCGFSCVATRADRAARQIARPFFCRCAAQRTSRLSMFLSRVPSSTTAWTWPGAQAPKAPAISTAAQHSQHSASAMA